MVEKRKLICISCPVGCELDVTLDEGKIIDVGGNACKLGLDYAEQEIFDPRRMVATTVKVKNGYHPLVPVYTEKPVPKPKIFDVLMELRKVEIEAPVKINDVVIENVVGTGINVIASRDLPKA
ncbi:MAG TPA: molybdopterin oxidoreductase [Anaerolineaceae bacterium]|jgi:CxxC motif-containing protein|nr:molybdopterin oxidoreductase [Anaerolineaceae bacterium]